MGNDLVKLYKELKSYPSTEENARIIARTEDRLYDNMRVRFMDLLEIGGAIGYERLEEELRRAADLVGKLKKA